MPEPDQALFPLEPEHLSVTLRVRGEDVIHVFAPLTAEDWIELERLSAMVSWRDSEGLIRTESMEPQAAADLWQRRIRTVGGCEVHPCEAPLKHKLAAIAGLSQVFAVPGEGPREAGGNHVAIILEAARNGCVYRQLEHVFRRPTMAHELRYERISSASHAVRYDGDVRKSVTLSRLPDLIELYDELIADTDGYDWGLVSGAKMDAMHKKQAVIALFDAGLGE